MTQFRNVLLIILLSVLIWGTVEASLTVREFRFAVARNSDKVSSTITDLRRVVLSFGGTAAELRETAKEINAASKEQRAYYAETGRRINALLGKGGMTVETANSLLAHLDSNLNDRVMPVTLASLGELHDSAASLHETMEGVRSIVTAPENQQLQENLNELVVQGILTEKQATELLAQWQKVGVEMEKVPPVARKTLLVQILSTIATTLKTVLE